MNYSAFDWLLQEAIDHLAEDSVGVYELLWLARGSDFQLNDANAQKLTRDVVGQLVTTGAAKLIILKWLTNEVISSEPENIDMSSDAIFDPNAAGEYLALMSTDMGIDTNRD